MLYYLYEHIYFKTFVFFVTLDKQVQRAKVDLKFPPVPAPKPLSGMYEYFKCYWPFAHIP